MFRGLRSLGTLPRASSMVDDTLKRFSSTDLTFGVIGLGYVGLPLAVEAARSGVDRKSTRLNSSH